MNSMIQRLQNDLDGLRNVHDFGWLRAAELGLLMWPENKTSAVSASRVIRSWIKRELVTERVLPDRAGVAVVLAKKGVQLLAEHGYEASTGSSWGTAREGVWMPPSSWRHDLIATGVLCQLTKLGWDVLPEAALLRAPKKPIKIPDGLARPPASEDNPSPSWHWLEVEHAHKSGKRLKAMANALYLAAQGGIKAVDSIEAKGALVAYTDVLTKVGHEIHHGTRVMTAVDAEAKVGDHLTIGLIHAKIAGASVTEIVITNEKVRPNPGARVLRVLDANGWKYDKKRGGYCSHYGDCIAVIKQSFERNGFWYSVERSGKSTDPKWSDSKTGAKAAASVTILALRKET